MAPLNHRHAVGIARREFLQVGVSGFLGLTVLDWLGAIEARAATPGSASADALILVFLTGGLGHLDSWDLKPDAPEGIRGEFHPIQTSAPGIQICEHLPRLAQHAHTFAIVRSLSHIHTNHLNATHQILTGHPQPGAFFDKIASRDDFPCYAAAYDALRPHRDGTPSGVMLPTFLMEGPLVWPGQHAGFLGPRHDPWQIRKDPSQPDFREDTLRLPDGFAVERLQRRHDLLSVLAAQRDHLTARAESTADPLAARRQQAYDLLLSGRVGRAFRLDQEDPRTRDRYGRHMFGQSLLLARRLVEARVPIVQVNMGRVQTWDTHTANFATLRDRLLPPLDQSLAALLDDLAARGRLERTLVVVAGEFGRTPRIGASTGNNNSPDGRDHWSACFSAVFAGGGVRGGQVVGASDRHGAYPATRPYSPADLAATIYQALGIQLNTELRDRLNRPLPLCTGQPITPLFGGSSA
ncbi:MAG: hypothetical protein KatS3mg108_1024 [Isosphaeraceae bacterium]|nr:MAG: hypothetical protein KatS3mg108_1024 [Isosphaeraceae bacterium]